MWCQCTVCFQSLLFTQRDEAHRVEILNGVVRNLWSRLYVHHLRRRERELNWQLYIFLSLCLSLSLPYISIGDIYPACILGIQSPGLTFHSLSSHRKTKVKKKKLRKKIKNPNLMKWESCIIDLYWKGFLIPPVAGECFDHTHTHIHTQPGQREEIEICQCYDNIFFLQSVVDANW